MRTIIIACTLLALLAGCGTLPPVQQTQSSSQPAIQGKEFLDQQRYEEAIAAYREAIRLNRDDGFAHYGLGVGLSRMGRDDQAITAYREAIRLLPRHADAHYGLAVVMERTGQAEAAIRSYREVIQLRRDDALAHYGLGVNYGRTEQNEAAVDALREAIRLKPDLADAHYHLGRAYERLGQLAQAVAAYREVIRLRPQDVLAYYSLGLAYGKQGEDEQAATALREAIRLKPDHAEAYYTLGVVYGRMGQYEPAIAAYREALRLRPDHIDAYTGLGAAQGKLRQDDQAITVYREALRHKPGHVDAYYGLWVAYQAKGNQAEARRALQEYQRLVAGGKPVQAVQMARAEPREPAVAPATEVAPPPPAAAAPISLPTLPEPAVAVPSPPAVTPAPPAAPPSELPRASPPLPEAVPTPPPTAPPAILEAMPAEAPAPTPPPAPISPPAPVVVAPAPPQPVPSQPPLVAVTTSTAQRRTALVIGNAAYSVNPLRNPVNDAADMAASLRQLGFQVAELHDAGLQRMEEAVEQFTRQLGGGGVGVFYFSGHGVQVNGLNYLVPVDARISRESDVKYQSVHIDWVLDRMREAANELNFVILDACRNNPYARSWRSGQQGLAAVEAVTGSLIAYATAPGTTAEDGPGRNGTYTKHLLHFMQMPGLSVEQMFKEVRVAVAQETGRKQIPWVSTSILGDFYFTGWQ